MARRNEDILDRLLGGFSVRGILLHPATMFVVASFMLVAAAIFLWEKHSDKVVNLEEFRLTEDRIRVTPPPSWANDDLKKLVLAESIGHDENGEATILDTQLVPRTAEIMRNVGYVERVERIEKSKEGLDIQLVYRKPVALVEFSQSTFPYEWPRENRGKSIFWPVDRLGVVMPESLGIGKALPKILVVYPIASGSQFNELQAWSDWPDERIKDAAAISALFENSRELVGFARVVTRRNPNQAGDSTIFYELWPDTGTQVVWGNAPGKEVEGEASSQEKLQALETFVKERGPLYKLPSQRMDIRSGVPVRANEVKTASLKRLFLDQK